MKVKRIKKEDLVKLKDGSYAVKVVDVDYDDVGEVFTMLDKSVKRLVEAHKKAKKSFQTNNANNLKLDASDVGSIARLIPAEVNSLILALKKPNKSKIGIK